MLKAVLAINCALLSANIQKDFLQKLFVEVADDTHELLFVELRDICFDVSNHVWGQHILFDTHLKKREVHQVSKLS